MPPPFPHALPPQILFPLLAIDFGTSLLTAIACFFIFSRTKMFYTLTRHEGIKYFRMAFFFFGISFLIQAFRPVAHFLGPDARPFIGFLTAYIGSVAVFALLYSVLWKRFPIKAVHPGLIMNGAAVLVAASALFGHFRTATLLLQGVVFLIAILVSYNDSRAHKAKAASLHILYVLLFLSWLANIFATVAMRESPWLSAALNVTSLILFLVIAGKVYRRTRAP